MTHATLTRTVRRAMRIGHILTWCQDWDTARDGLIELLADARHWCDREGESFAALDRMAYQRYLDDRHTFGGEAL